MCEVCLKPLFFFVFFLVCWLVVLVLLGLQLPPSLSSPRREMFSLVEFADVTLGKMPSCTLSRSVALGMDLVVFRPTFLHSPLTSQKAEG